MYAMVINVVMPARISLLKSVLKFFNVESQTKNKSFISQFAGINGKISNNFEYDPRNFFTLGFESSFNVQRYPEYTSQFTDGELKVKESYDQLLHGTIEASFTSLSKKDRINKIYILPQNF